MQFQHPVGQIIDTGASKGKAFLGVVATLAIIISLWACVAYVPPGHAGVLTSFGRVTGEVLPEGTHFVSPFKINHVLTIRTQSQEEHTSTPRSSAPSAATIPAPSLSLPCAPSSVTPPPDTPPTPFTPAHVSRWKTKLRPACRPPSNPGVS